MHRSLSLLSLLALLAAGATAPARAGETLDAVRLRGEVVCGVSGQAIGFSQTAPDGTRSGLDVDMCRAVAAAVFGDADQVEFVELSNADRFDALRYGEVDVLIRNTTWTYARDTTLELTFTGISYYDGQGFLVHSDAGIRTLEDLDGKRICYKTATTHALNLETIFAARDLAFEPMPMDETDLAVLMFQNRRCDALSSDQSELFGIRSALAAPDTAYVMPLLISKEPLGPSVRQDDPEWANIVEWTLFAMINAEELGVTRANLAEMQSSPDPAVQLLLNGAESEAGTLGLAAGWPAQVIAQVGNYGEVFDRNLGAESPIGIKRGLNALWTEGGLMYAPPFR
ncbi:amino acid ABC transporter substrate-binding protein [Pseudoponticoccus marisrubri]|uniref:amino acid ABC transporter substrate-binding protein n=1 Tax=Pseudoponticoccus marisrubri TaxID=1685382 RepID=UPI0009FF0792|nr:amino acid ABC transporter substrate-binding protein [Pseudoponticoccus marisrubri]